MAPEEEDKAMGVRVLFPTANRNKEGKQPVRGEEAEEAGAANNTNHGRTTATHAS